jgi:hypothetical protein
MSLPDTTTSSTSTMCQKFNIRTPDKGALVMELVGEMKSPEMVPVRRQLLGGGSKVTIHSLNNKTKRYIHVPQCKDRASAHTALRDYKVVEQIVETVGGGVGSPDGLGVSALWFGKGLAEINWDGFTTCSSRAGITGTTRMSPENTAAMWNDALVTKTKQRKISKHLFHWFGQPITAKEKDVDALAGKVYVERRYGEHSFLSRQGKKESDDDKKKRRRDITVKYWVSDPLLAAEDELITRLRGGKQIMGCEFPLLDVSAIPMIFLAGHGNVAWRAGLTIVGSEADGQGGL